MLNGGTFAETHHVMASYKLSYDDKYYYSSWPTNTKPVGVNIEVKQM